MAASPKDVPQHASNDEDDHAFPFPFVPYAMQQEVMAAIRATIREGRIGVIESPTGTGKSQMLLNGVLSTVFPRRRSATASADGDGHVDSSAKGSAHKRPRMPGGRSGTVGRCRGRRASGKRAATAAGAASDEDLLQQSDNGSDNPTRRGSSSSSSASDAEDDAMMNPLAAPKVYFSSRTHSQLTQLAQELRRTVFSDDPATTRGGGGREGGPASAWPSLRFVHVASRAQLCVNRRVQLEAGASHQRLNDLCRSALRVGGTKDGRAAVKTFWKQRDSDHRPASTPVDVEDLRAGMGGCEACPFAHADRLKLLKDHARASSRTMEELKDLGKSLGACPFLATKALIREAHVVLLPYSYLIDGVARSQLLPDALFEDETNVDGVVDVSGEADPPNAFRGNVVVFDEAHHVADVARRSSSATVSSAQLAIVASLLRAYGERYELRLLAKNKAKIRELVGFSERLTAFVSSSWAAARARYGPAFDESGTCSTLSDVLFGAQVDYVNTCSLVHFLEESMLVHKLPSQATAAAIADRMRMAMPAATDTAAATASVCVWEDAGRELMPFLSMRTESDAPPQCRMLSERLRQAAQAACLAFLAFLRCVSAASWTETVAILRPLCDQTASLAVDAKGAAHGSPRNPAVPGQTPSLASIELCIVSLTGAAAMAAIVGHARSVVFAGGTMQPLSMLVDPLLHGQDAVDGATHCTAIVSETNPRAGDDGGCVGEVPLRAPLLPPPRYDHRAFPHVIPASSLRVLTLGCGPSGRPVELTFSNRPHLATQWEDVGRTLLNLCRVVPHGVIVCFTSYAMEASFFDAAARNGILDQLEGIKRVFREQRAASATPSSSKTDASPSNDLLTLYSKWIENSDKGRGQGTQTVRGKRGAILSCVMGGKLSEGINFNDHLGRGVVVVGLPYPNPSDTELNLQMAMCAEQQAAGRGINVDGAPGGGSAVSIASILDGMARRPSTAAASNGDGATTSTAAASARRKTQAEMELYHAVCMRSVNQCMGRCIRHANDFAVVVLLDGRFRRPEVSRHIASWMQPSIVHCATFGECFRNVREFFEAHPSS